MELDEEYARQLQQLEDEGLVFVEQKTRLEEGDQSHFEDALDHFSEDVGDMTIAKELQVYLLFLN